MRLAEDAGVVHGDVRVFARNGLVAVVPVENRAGINGLSDLARPGLKLVIAGEDVPIGAYTREFLQKAEADPELGPSYAEQVLANVVSEENDVRQVMARGSAGRGRRRGRLPVGRDGGTG